MRAKEFMIENSGRTRARTPGQLKKSYDYANPGAVTGADMDRYYDLYRSSMLMERSPSDIEKLDTASWMNNRGYIGYRTKEERDKIDAAFKALGITPDDLIEPGSMEQPDTNSESPIQPFKGYNT